MKYYLYRHIRLDTNQPFYVGVGTKFFYNSYYKEYGRAFSTHSRNVFWKRIVAKTEYRIEIIYESDLYEDVLQKEKEFILLYGRRFNNSGTLVNITEGGEGTNGYKPSIETRQKMSDSRKKHRTPRPSKRKAIMEIDMHGNSKVWNSLTEAAKFYNCSKSGIHNVLNGSRKLCKERNWRYVNQTEMEY